MKPEPRELRSTIAMKVKTPAPDAGNRQTVLVQVYPPGINLGRRFPLTEIEHIAGRLPDLDISLDEEAISRRHARLFREGSDWSIEDLGSTNGSYVNDERVQRRLLRDGDMIRLGTAILKFLTGANIEAAYHEEIYRMSIVDHLTGVHNKRYFLEFLEREIARALRYQTPLSLVLFDIDHFKKINDTHGHLAGDMVLRELGRRLKPRIRREDLLARYGGEEFVCVLANTGLGNALLFAENVRAMVEFEPFREEDLDVPVTISLGVTEFDPQEQSGEKLIARTDANLYTAKRGGRNRVIG